MSKWLCTCLSFGTPDYYIVANRNPKCPWHGDKARAKGKGKLVPLSERYERAKADATQRIVSMTGRD